MLYQLRHKCFHNFVLSAVLCSTAIATCLPAQEFKVLNEKCSVIPIVRLEKLVNKLLKSKDKDSQTIVGYLVDIKNEIETSFNIKIDLDQQINLVNKKLSESGQSLSKQQIKSLRVYSRAKIKK